MRTTAKHVVVTTADYGRSITLRELPNAGYDGVTMYRLGVQENTSDREVARMDWYDAKTLRDALTDILGVVDEGIGTR